MPIKSKSRKKRSKSKRKKSRARRSSSGGLNRWFEEVWVDVCKLPKIVKCGRRSAQGKNWKKGYPYCRPLKRINASTPKTAREMSKAEIRRRCGEKKRNPLKKVYGSRSNKKQRSKKQRSRRSKSRHKRRHKNK